MLAKDQQYIFVATANENKLIEYKRLLPESYEILGISELAEALNIPVKNLDSAEKENDYQLIAKGKIEKIQEELVKHQEHLNLDNIIILGDDYGAACDAIHFKYDETMDNSDEFVVDFDSEHHIESIRTSRVSLNDKPAPGYFSHRIINSTGIHHGLDPASTMFKKEAFELLAKEMIYQANRYNNHQTTATVAIAYAQGLKPAKVVLHTGEYRLIANPGEIDAKGFDFDRVQLITKPSGQTVTVSSLTKDEKDSLFVRGLAVREVMNKIISELQDIRCLNGHRANNLFVNSVTENSLTGLRCESTHQPRS